MSAALGTPAPSAGALRFMPAAFVLIWSTGFIVARYGMPHASPMIFLVWRYGLSVLAFAIWVALSDARWPAFGVAWWHLAVAGCLIHAGYLGCVWAAVKLGMAAGPVALIVGLQPVLTAVWVAHASGGHHVNKRQWLGLLLGLGGVVLVVLHKLGVGEVTRAGTLLALAALLSITLGSLYQKRFIASGDVRTGNLIQLAAALLVTAPLAVLEQGSMDWHPQLVGALAWSVLALSLGASSMFYVLLQRGAATKVTSWMYLVPPSTALMAWLLFHESLAYSVLLGLVLAGMGVWLVVAEPVASESKLQRLT